MKEISEMLKLSHCACFNLRKTARRVTQAYDQALRPTGLRVTQFSLLAHLQNRPPVPISVLAEEMELDRTTLSRNLGPLREAGLLLLQPGRDARVQEVSITEAGRRRHVEALPFWRNIQQKLANLMGAEGLSRLLDDLEGVRTVISGREDSKAEVSGTEVSGAEAPSTEFKVRRIEVKRIQVQRIEIQRSQDEK